MSDEQKQEAKNLEVAVETDTPKDKEPIPVELCRDPEKIIKEIDELNTHYRVLISQKYQIVIQLQKVEEAIQKCMGAYQALKKLYVTATQAKEKANV